MADAGEQRDRASQIEEKRNDIIPAIGAKVACDLCLWTLGRRHAAIRPSCRSSRRQQHIEKGQKMREEFDFSHLCLSYPHFV